MSHLEPFPLVPPNQTVPTFFHPTSWLTIYTSDGSLVPGPRGERYFRIQHALRSAILWRILNCQEPIRVGMTVEVQVSGYHLRGLVIRRLGEDSREAVFEVHITSEPEASYGPSLIFLLVPLLWTEVQVCDEYTALTGSMDAEADIRQALAMFPQGQFQCSRLLRRVRRALLQRPVHTTFQAWNTLVIDAGGVFVQGDRPMNLAVELAFAIPWTWAHLRFHLEHGWRWLFRSIV